MSPFARTDLIVCVTDLDDSHMDFRNHRGAGRLLHLDAGFSPKGVLWTEAHGLVVGAAFSPGMDLLVTADPVARAVVAFDGAGRRIGRIDGLPDRPFGSVAFDAEGRCWLGVHSERGGPPADTFGPARLVRFRIDPAAASARELEGFVLDTDGGRSGWHAVTSFALERGGERVVHCAEGGRRVMRTDLVLGAPLADAVTFAENVAERAYGVAALPDGGLLLATGIGAERRDAAGAVIMRVRGEAESGWTRVTPTRDGKCFFLNNFLVGRIEKRDLQDGRLLGTADVGKKYALCAIAEAA